MAKRWFSFFTLALVSASSFAEAPSIAELPVLTLSEVRTEKTPPSYMVGDTISLKLGEKILSDSEPLHQVAVAVPEGGSQLKDLGWATPKIIRKGNPPELFFEFTPIKAGKLQIPVLVVNKQGIAAFRTELVAYEIQSAIAPDDPNPTQPNPVKPPLSFDYPWVWIALYAFIALAVLAAGIYYLVRWNKKRKTKIVEMPKVVEPPKSEDVWALDELRKLQEKAYWKKGDFKTHYFRVSEILKTYLERRYGFPALESTAREILYHLESGTTVDLGLRAKLKNLFDSLDLIKFTDRVPNETDAVSVLEECREWVLATKKVEIIQTAPIGAKLGGQSAV